MGSEYAYQVYWRDKWGHGHYSPFFYDEGEADEFADNRMHAGANDPPRVIVLEV